MPSHPFSMERIPDGSYIYLQTPENHFLMGVLHIAATTSIVEIVVRDGYNFNLYANLRPFNHNTNYISTEYRCYIRLPNGSFLTSLLHIYNNNRSDFMRRMSISVIINSEEGFTLYMGTLSQIFGPPPAWIPRRNEK